VGADEAGDRDPAGEAADLVVSDLVPLGVATQQVRADQDAGGDNHPERLDRNVDDGKLERAEVDERQPGGPRGGRGR
jgi:hypothetical protein